MNNRAWMIRAEQRLEQLEAKVKQQAEQIEALKAAAAPVEAEPVKRGPGRPPKVSE